MMNVLIVEDDFSFALEVEMAVKELGYAVLPIQSKAEDTLEWLQRETVDLVIADNYLSGQMKGVELVRKMHARGIPVIFMTSNSDFVTYHSLRDHHLEAFLVKPFDLLTLQTTIDLAFKRQEQRHLPAEDALFIKKGQLLEKVTVDEIVYIESEGNYCFVYTKEKRKYAVKTSIRKFLDRIVNAVFIQIHRNYAVNFSNVEAIDFQDAEIYLAGGGRLPIGQTYRKEIQEAANRI